MQVSITYKNKIYNIDSEPFETYEDTYRRGWYIVKNIGTYTSYNELVSMSIIHSNLKKEMQYDI